jgi:hypothetical protein
MNMVCQTMNIGLGPYRRSPVAEIACKVFNMIVEIRKNKN